MAIPVQNDWRNRSIFISVLLLLISVFVSRAALSVCLVLFFVCTSLHTGIAAQAKRMFQTPYLFCLSALFYIPVISGLWSTNTTEWLEVMKVKLPFLIVPFAFAGKWQLRPYQWKTAALLFLSMTAAGCCWSLIQYLNDPAAISKSYLSAKTIPTPLGDDHVRYSWLVCIAIFTGIALLYGNIVKWRKALLCLVLLFFVIYLHVLAARTGLLMVYLFFFFFAVYVNRRSWRRMGLIAFLLIAVAAAAWYSLPTLRNRISYNLYDLSFVLNNRYRAGTSDGNRVASMRAGWAVWQKQPVLGAGAGDVRAEVNQWYETNLTGMADSDKIYPSSEWLAHADVAGWFGLILFTVIIGLPFGVKNIRHRFFWQILHAVTIPLLLIETSLETQYGIFIYTFFFSAGWKILSAEKQINLKHD